MLERQAVMAALVMDGLERQDEHSRQMLSLEIVFSDAVDYLQSLEACSKPDVIYMDPMHPKRKKSAKVKKDLQILQVLFGTDSDALSLLDAALHSACQRVVVKWPQKQPALIKPSYSIMGKTIRFDVYTPGFSMD